MEKIIRVNLVVIFFCLLICCARTQYSFQTNKEYARTFEDLKEAFLFLDDSTFYYTANFTDNGVKWESYGKWRYFSKNQVIIHTDYQKLRNYLASTGFADFDRTIITLERNKSFRMVHKYTPKMSVVVFKLSNENIIDTASINKLLIFTDRKDE